MVNGKHASLDTKLNDNDSITIDEATHGNDVVVQISEIVDRGEKLVFNGNELNLIKSISVNGEVVNGDYVLNDTDKVYIERIKNVRELLEVNDVNFDKSRVFVNNALVDKDYILKKNDDVRN